MSSTQSANSSAKVDNGIYTKTVACSSNPNESIILGLETMEKGKDQMPVKVIAEVLSGETELITGIERGE